LLQRAGERGKQMADVSISTLHRERSGLAACMRTPEAARYVALSESSLTKMRLSGGDGPPFVKVGPRAVAYRKADLDAWLETRVRRSTSEAPMAA
jgi:predicted DNA-binding transcriptional regulator AlpA